MTLPGNERFFPGRNEIAALMRAKDWSSTTLGSPETWSNSLRTIVRVLLTSRFAMWLGWGPDLSFLYNDAYAAMTLSAKHPWALGRPASEVWAEIWREISPRIARVLQTGDATWDEDLQLFLERSGYPEETYHTFSYSPVTDDDGAVVGMLCVVSEETERVIGERRMALLHNIAARTASANAEAEYFAALRDALASDPYDLPFTLTYLFDEKSDIARLACRSGISADHAASVSELSRSSDNPVWPLEAALMEPEGVVVDLSERFGDLPSGAWSASPARALVVPIPQQGQRTQAGIFVAALNPFRPIDAGYRSFVSLVVGQVAAGIANAHAYEEERRRAEALTEIDRAKTTFFSNVSHEFRTPLTLMLAPLDELLDRSDTGIGEESRDTIAMVQRNGQRLLKLVNTLLDFSRIEAGRVRARFEPVDLAALTTDLASTFQSAMDRAALDFRVEAARFAAPVYVDRDMWEKIVLNLISNAFKFTLQGSIVVSLARKHGSAVLSVRDTGTGIPEGELPNVFDRFHRVEGLQGRSHEGSGIGLALVHELVKLHGGELTVESEVGRGSCFSVAVPLGSSHLPADQIVPAASSPSQYGAHAYVAEALRWLPSDEASTLAFDATAAENEALRNGLAVGHILLADDNADMRDYARRLLLQRWTVDVVANGVEALAAARRRRPDVVVTDVMMPELDGFGLLRELRADTDLQTIPVIMLSARAGEEARIEGLAASADDYLVKPFSARDLLARVDAQVLKSRLRAVERRHAQRMTSLFMHAPVAIAILSGPDFVYEMANSEYLTLVGDRAIVGKPIREALPELAGQGIFELLEQVWVTGEPYVGHSRRVTLSPGPKGVPEETFVDFVYQPLFDETGHVESVVAVVHDVTPLASAKHEAEAANRLKDEFLATLSHELRTPLNAVLGYTQMLRGGAIGPERLASVLETIERNAKLQEQLVSDVLDVSRIITGKLRLDVRAVDLTRVIQDALETVAPAATAKGVRLQPIVDHPGLPVAGDAQRLQQVVWNVLSNAVKFTPRGGRVQIRLARVHSHVEITISDTGEGISPEFLPHLFQRFQQADGTFTRSHSGLGLGLAISRHLVEAHGGSIDATSPGKGRGTTVRVELPLMIVHDSRSDSADRVHPSADVLASVRDLNLADLEGIRVLLVDDDGDALQMAKDALMFAGASVVTAGNARQALTALDENTFDVAVLDIGMPGVDGYQLLHQIRHRPDDRQGRLPAAALTAYARSIDRTRSLKGGFQMHLSKPVQPTELAAAVLTLSGKVRS